MAQRIYGIDLGSHLVKVAVLEVGFRQTALRQVVSVPVADFAGVVPAPEPASQAVSGAPDSAEGNGGAEAAANGNGALQEPIANSGAVMAALKEALARAGGRPDLAVLGLPGDLASFRVLEFPFTDARKVAAVLGYELEGQIPYELEDVVFDHQLMATPSGEGRALVGIAAVKRTAQLLELVRQAGLEPQVLTVSPMSYGYLGLAEEGEPVPQAVLDIGHERTNLVVLRGPSTVLCRTISRGGAQITRGLAARYQVSEVRAAELKHTYAQLATPGGPAIPSDRQAVTETVEAELLPLVRAVRQSLLGLRQRPALYPQRLLLCGGGSGVRGLPELLERELEIPVAPSLPASAPTGVGGRGQVLAVGLARAAADRQLPTVNLRQGPLALAEDHSIFRKRALYFAWSAVAILGLLVLNGFFSLWTLQKEEKTLRAGLAHKTLEILNRPMNDDEEVTRRINAALKTRKASSLPIPDASAYAVLSEISRQLPGNTEVTLDVTRLNIRDGKIEFEGSVKEAGQVDTVVAALKKIKCFSKVNQGRSSEVSFRYQEEGEVKSEKRWKFTLDIAHECM